MHVDRRRCPILGKFNCSVAVGLILLILPPAAWGTEITVDTLSDEYNSDGDCSLREAIQASRSNTATDACPAGQAAVRDAIVLPTGTIHLSLGSMVIDDEVSIAGDTVSKTVLDRGGSDEQIFDIEGGAVTLDSLVLTNSTSSYGAVGVADGAAVTVTSSVISNNGSTLSYGGGLYVGGELVLIDSTVVGNTASRGGGIAIQLYGTVRVQSSSIVSNVASHGGGGIYGSHGFIYLDGAEISGNQVVAEGNGAGISSLNWLEIRESTFFDNSVPYLGAGGGVEICGYAEIQRSTFSSNEAPYGAAVLVGDSMAGCDNAMAFLENVTISGQDSAQGFSAPVQLLSTTATLTMVNCTVARNEQPTYGGIRANVGTVYLYGVVLADNSGSNCATFNGTIQSEGFNLDDDTTCGLSGTDDLSGVDALLGALADNGGPTETCPPLAASPVIDSIDSGLAWVPDEDQRGVARPSDGDQNGSALADRGAVEIAEPFFADDFETGNPDNWSESLP